MSTPVLTPDQIAAQAAGTTAATTPQEFVIETATGQKFIGKTQDEVLQKMKESIENGSRTIKELSDARTQIQQVQQAVNPPQAPAGTWDANKYWELNATDPRAAIAYAMADYLGLPQAELLRSEFQSMASTTRDVQEQIMGSSFINQHPEFPAGDDKAAEALVSTLKSLVQAGQPVNLSTMEAAHGLCVAQGKYQPVQQQSAATTPEQQRPIPVITGGASNAPSDDITQRFLGMTRDQQRDFLNSEYQKLKTQGQ